MTAWTTPKTWSVSEFVTAALLNTHLRDNELHLYERLQGLGLVASRTSSDFTKNNSIALSNVPGLSFSVAANEVWLFFLIMHFISSAVADLKIGLTFPTGASGRYGTMHYTSSFDDVIANTLLVEGGGSAILPFVAGVVVNGANPGTVQLQAAQNTAEVSNTIIYSNSAILAAKIA